MARPQPEGKKVFHDPIHGHMEFDPILVKIIDTPQFQRLRNLKQLGGAYFVYPGASHNRFEHSLGVAHLAGQLVQNLKEKQPELEIDDRDVVCVEIAGLCHDLGHGPFSHMFDGMFIPKARPDRPEWKHEKASVQMFEHIVEKLKDNGFDLLEMLKAKNKDNKGNDLEFIKEMINGPKEKGHYKGRPSNKSFLYEIVSNKRNGLDVDKFDYFARDCHHLGIRNSFDHRRFLQFIRVCDVDGQLQICTRDKELSNIYEMFHTRSCLHRKAYQHKTNKIMELMITEALLKADPILNISAKIDDMEDYSKLSDCIVEEILYSSGNDLKEAREILEKVVSREHYLYLGKTKMKEMPKVTEELKEEWRVELAKTSVTTYQEEAVVTKDDFEFIITAFDFGMKEKNPMENLHFYSKSDKTKAFKIPSAQVSQFLLPVKFSEKWINVYCRSSDKSKVAYRHFYQWCRDKDFLLPPSPSQSKAVGPEPKVFNDPIHGLMEFQPDLVKIIDTPQFQRLRFIKQLGGAYFVYPGASHSRFEHSLGVAHLAGQLVRSLQKKQPELDIAEKDILCVEIAGLCHDLGHGPFSEVFDQIFLEKVKCERSKVSANLFKQIKERLNLNLLQEDMTFIEELINGIDTEETPQGRPQKRFLYDIVNNKRNGVDVNVFDSVARDCHQLGLKTHFDHQRFIQFAKVLTVKGKPQICIRDKVESNVYDLFHTIAALHSKAYQHKVTMKIELMMSEIVKETMQHTMTNEVTLPQALEVYSQMTDSRFGERSAENPVARNIWERIHSRNLYKYLDTFETEQTLKQTCATAELAEEIATALAVQKDHIGLYVSSMVPQNCSTETINGMNFYDKSGRIIPRKEIDEKPQISKPDISHKQRTYVFYKGTDQTVATKEKVETLKRTLQK